MIKIKQAVIVEGKYDKIKLESILDTVIIATDGFGIFKDREKQLFIRILAKKRGILVLTDSDSAGFVIRSFLSSIVPPESVTHVYIPDVFGKEKRKAEPSKEGKLGVEGVSTKIILDALKKAGITASDLPNEAERRLVTKTDLYEDGICGKSNSLSKRQRLLKDLGLPEKTSANSMLKIINTFLSYDDYKQAVKNITEEER